ncbi:AAA family ATPase [Algoriphagus sp. H41]|uniref:DNA 3'-5' helicase II n=1 Tax=Algoriphagus oliviformis TaxID=2811231 RepID=A0ABS3C5S1_9BACT|nr:3'-5' exonuclease [Algoriphagus oliviformis]MBN7810939.1 AAA family ATPase [Algoriphagus oliviformis]
MAWMIREDQLDPDQREFINVESKKSGNIWVKGFAGSGKSVLLIHSLKNVLQKEPNAKIAVVVYTHSLIDMFKTGMKELNIPSSIPVITYIEFCDKNSQNFDYIFCDEVQDLPSRVLYAMNNRSRKVIVAGDSNQSIYDTDPRWNEPVVNPSQVGDIINARAFSLNMIHRLTRSIIAAVQKLLPSMNIWGAKRDLTKQDVNIRLCEASSETEEVKYIYQEAQKGANVGDTSVILLPTLNMITKFANQVLSANNKPQWSEKKNSWNKPDYGDLNRHFRNNGIKIQFIGSGYGSLSDAERNKEAILMTYHSAKGLDFDNVFLPYLNNSFYLHPSNASTLFMVAMTRSRKNLYLTYFGYTHDLVDKFKGECTEISISDILNQRTSTRSNNNFDF